MNNLCFSATCDFLEKGWFSIVQGLIPGRVYNSGRKTVRIEEELICGG